MGSDNVSPLRRRPAVRAVKGVLPHSTEIERELLGAIAADADTGNAPLRCALDLGLLHSHFASDDHARLYRICCDLWTNGTPPALPLLFDTLCQRVELDEAQRLVGLMSASATNAHPDLASHFVRRILDTWQQREILKVAADLAGLGATQPLPRAEIAALQERLGELTAPDSGRITQLVTPLSVLATQPLPDLHLIVNPILPAGLIILGGRPKMGKSWLALNLGLSVASGAGAALGRFTSAESGRVLYLSLEDTKRRIVDRAVQCCADDPLPERLDVATEWPRLNEGGLSLIEEWLRAHPDRKLVIADTLAMVRAEPKENDSGNLYAADYAAIRQLKQLADRYDVAILVVHHLRKSASTDGDPVEELSGTYGLSGAADTILVLKRQHGEEEGTLLGRGRDLEDIEWAMRFDKALGIWTAFGDANDLSLSRERRELLELLRVTGPMTPKRCSEQLGKRYENVKVLLAKMARGYQLSVDSAGRYSVPARQEADGGNQGNRG